MTFWIRILSVSYTHLDVYKRQVSAFATCVLIVVTVGIKWIENEVKQSSKFRYECVYGLFVRFLAPI